MSLYGSVDLHSNNCYVAVSDEKDALVSHKRIPNNLEEVNLFFRQYQDQMPEIVVESTFNSYWLVDGLQDLGYQVKLANPGQMHQYTGLKHTDDKSDCLWLNRMNRLGVLPTGYIYPRKERAVRDLLRRRMLMVRVRTKLICSLKNQFLTWKAVDVSRKEVFRLEIQDVETTFEDETLRLSGTSMLEVIQNLSSRIKIIESYVHKKAKEDGLVERLRILRGIGPILSWVIRYETGDIRRFESGKHFMSYCGLVESKKISNFKVKGKNNPKNRNKFLRWAFAEAAIASMAHPPLKNFHDRLVKKKGKIKAKAILSSKMARAAFMLMSDPSFHYEERKLFNY